MHTACTLNNFFKLNGYTSHFCGHFTTCIKGKGNCDFRDCRAGGKKKEESPEINNNKTCFLCRFKKLSD